MANVKISVLASYSTQHGDDVLPILDIHDTSMASSGTDKGCTVHNLFGGPSTGQFLVWSGSSTGAITGHTMVGSDLPVFVASGSSHAAGAVPDPGASSGTTKYLREDATWVVPPGSGSGTVTSVTFTGDGTVLNSNPSSAVTTSGTLTATLLTQSANKFLAGPITPGTALPTFRSVVYGDLPIMVAAGLAGHAPGVVPDPGASSSGGTKFLCDNATWAVPSGTYTPPGSGPGSGTVTSVTFTGDGTVLSSTPSAAVTSSGTLTATLKTQAARKVLIGPTSGSDAAPTFRLLVASDLPSGADVIFSQVTAVSISTSTDSTLVSTTNAVGSLTIAANSLVAGKSLRLRFGGYYVTSALPVNCEIYAKLGSYVISGTGTLTTQPPPASQSYSPWSGEILLACTVGGNASTSKVFSSGYIKWGSSANAGGTFTFGPSTSIGSWTSGGAAASPDLTTDLVADVRFKQAGLSNLTTVTQTHLLIESLG